MAWVKNAFAAIGVVAVAGTVIRILASKKTEAALRRTLDKCREFENEFDECEGCEGCEGCSGCCCPCYEEDEFYFEDDEDEVEPAAEETDGDDAPATDAAPEKEPTTAEEPARPKPVAE